MKKTTIKNRNGITVCDSIVMSVKNKRPYTRRLEAVIIAIIGLVSVLMSFFGMFSFKFNETAVTATAVFFAIFYTTLILIGKKALWVIAASLLALAGAALKMLNDIIEGFKFVYNIIYRESFKNDINYYKYVDPDNEEFAATVLFIFGIWLIAFVICFFTIYHPNMILPLIVTFPVIEIGLYNGIAIPIFWGMMTIGYWIAMFCMTSTDMGEYSGGTGGFVRKDNVFSPKRQMRLKVTERCGILVIASVMIVSVLTSAIINITGYERSDEINRKRRELSAAFEDFSIDNLAESISKIAGVFGLSFKYNNNKLGNKDHISYKNVTDLEVTFDRVYNGAVYIKENVSSVYKENEWLELSSKKYNDPIFEDFKNYKIFPQDFSGIFASAINPTVGERTVSIDSHVKKERLFSPYGTLNVGGLSYNRDMIVTSIGEKSKQFDYTFLPVDTEYYGSLLTRGNDLNLDGTYITNDEWRNTISEYCSSKGMTLGSFTINEHLNIYNDNYYNRGQLTMATLLENEYRDFVYANYLQVPENSNMKEVRKEYSELINYAASAESPGQKLAILDLMRSKMANETTYTLAPGKTPSNRDFVNYFLMENKKGYCIHYATSGVLLARMAGIPARYATGYVIVADDFNPSSANPDGSYTIDVQDNRSHAWVELYLDGFGWVPYEFTAGYTERTISHGNPEEEQDVTSESEIPSESQTAQPPSAPNNNSATQNPTTTTTATSTTVTGGGNGTGNGTGKTAAAVKDAKNVGKQIITNIIITILSLLLIAAILYIRRIIILSSRKKRFTTGSVSNRINSMYRYSEHLLAILKIKNNNGNYTGFSKEVERLLSHDYFTAGDFDKFVDIALYAGFSHNDPDAQDIEFCAGFVDELAVNIYKKSGILRKIWLKIGNVLI